MTAPWLQRQLCISGDSETTVQERPPVDTSCNIYGQSKYLIESLAGKPLLLLPLQSVKVLCDHINAGSRRVLGVFVFFSSMQTNLSMMKPPRPSCDDATFSPVTYRSCSIIPRLIISRPPDGVRRWRSDALLPRKASVSAKRTGCRPMLRPNQTARSIGREK